MAQANDFLIRETKAEYCRKGKTHLRSHALADFRKCPLLYWKKRQGLVPDEDRPAYVVGRAAHKLILEGLEKFSADYVVGGPVNPKTGKPYGPQTKAYAEWAEAQKKGVLTDQQYRLIESLAGAVKGHEAVKALLSEGIPEAVVRAEYCGEPCQIRMDFYCGERGLLDLKTTDSLDYFESDATRFGYIHQTAFYRAVLAVVAGRQAKEIPVYLVGVEKREPFRCGVWRVGQDVLAIAQQENEAAIARLKLCRERNHWPTEYENLRQFDHL